MASLQRPSSTSPQNSITHAERLYLARSAKKPRAWRRWLNCTVMWLVITLSLIHIGGLLLASLTLRDPTPISRALGPLPALLILSALYYHVYLMFQTISLSANSISRERESQTWELLVLTGINARQIVRGKWWAILQHQLRRYLLLSLIRAGATTAFAISIAASFYYVSSYYNGQMQLPHPFTILMVFFFGTLFTLANMAFSAACGVMGSAVSKRSTMAIVRGLFTQIVVSIIPVIVSGFIATRAFAIYQTSTSLQSIYQFVTLGSFSLAENGLITLSMPVYVTHQYYNLESYTPLAPITFDWMGWALMGLVLYVLLIGWALWRAEKRAVKALAMPVKGGFAA